MGPYDILYTIIYVILTHLTKQLVCMFISTGTWELSLYLVMSFKILTKSFLYI